MLTKGSSIERTDRFIIVTAVARERERERKRENEKRAVKRRGK
jgi:hypothetical protein